MSLVETRSGRTVATSVEHAESFLARLKGLLFRTGIAEGHALVLHQTNSIHMMFMLFTIDVIFLDRDLKVTALCPGRYPFSLPVWSFSAYYAVEMAPGSIAKAELAVGDQLAFLKSVD
jgi:uncharacterized membrane protein (UPF0127 family)